MFLGVLKMKIMGDVSPGDVVSLFDGYMRVKSIVHKDDGWYTLQFMGYPNSVTGLSNAARREIEDETYE